MNRLERNQNSKLLLFLWLVQTDKWKGISVFLA